eukprot:1603154-Pyramimonas_sp.AAC.1
MDGDHDPFEYMEDITDCQQLLDGRGSFTYNHRGEGTNVENYAPGQFPAPMEDNDRRKVPPHQQSDDVLGGEDTTQLMATITADVIKELWKQAARDRHGGGWSTPDLTTAS